MRPATSSKARRYRGRRRAVPSGLHARQRPPSTRVRHPHARVNGMRGIHHRAPGPAVAAMRADQVILEIINDGVHVHREVVSSLRRPGRVTLDHRCDGGGRLGRRPYVVGSLGVTVGRASPVSRRATRSPVRRSRRTLPCGAAVRRQRLPSRAGGRGAHETPAAARSAAQRDSVGSSPASPPMRCCSASARRLRGVGRAQRLADPGTARPALPGTLGE